MILPQVISLSETKKKQKTISALYLARPFALSEYEIFKKNKKMKGKMLKQNIKMELQRDSNPQPISL